MEKTSCDSCSSPINWFIKIVILIIMVFILASSLYGYYLYMNHISLNNIKHNELMGR